MSQQSKSYIDDYFTLVYKDTSYLEESSEYRQRFSSMEKDVRAEEISEIITGLCQYPARREEWLLAEGMDEKNPTIRSLRKKKNRMKLLTTPIGKVLFGQDTKTKVSVYDPQHHTRVILNGFLHEGGTCHVLNRALDHEQLKYHSVVGPLDEDSRRGGCLHYLVKTQRGIAYNRLFLVVDKERDVVLFHDAIESNAFDRTNLAEYLRDGQQCLLRDSLATDIILAKRLGIQKIAFGEPELIDLASCIGAEMTSLFDASSCRNEEKLGLIASNEWSKNGPFAYRLNEHAKSSMVEPFKNLR